eukprot:22448_1
MPSKYDRSIVDKRKNRKEFRKQQRKIKKKSKKLAKQFGRLQRQNQLKINTQNKKKIKPILEHSKNSKTKKKHKKSVRFADAQHVETRHPSPPPPPQEPEEDVWIDEREEQMIKTLEKKMGFRRNEDTDKYWGRQEFTQDGLDCFFDLGYLSGDSDMDEQQQESYQKYAEFKEFLSTQDTNDDKPKAQLNSYKDYQQKRQKKEKIYGEAVHHSDDEETNDITMKAFLEESDDESEPELDVAPKNDSSSKKVNKYIPPQLRRLQSQMSDTNTQLKRCMGGHLNRLLSHNLGAISAVIHSFYTNNTYTSTQITTTLCDCVYHMMDKEEESNALNSIILCLSALVASLYTLNGSMIGSSMIEIFSNHIESNMRQRTMMMRHLLRFISYLYLFGMLSAKYVIQVLIQWTQTCDAESFNALSIPMLLCGTDLRTDDPIKFRDLIVLICGRSKALLEETNATKNEIDIEDAMKVICDIKDNKMQKKESRQLKELRASLGAVSRMSLSYADFLNIPQHGRWWLSGAPVKGGMIASKMNANPIWRTQEAAYSFSDELLRMSRRFHMNSPIRRAIFCIVMDSDDYIDAFQKLMQLNIKHGEQTEIIRIVVLLCLRQNQYNKYYALLLIKIINHKKGWKFGLHCALWDRFSQIQQMTTNDSLNMAHLVADLINEHCLNLVVLKKLDMIKTEPKNLLFVRTLFGAMLTKNNVFASLSRNHNATVRELRQDVQLFFTSVMMPRTQRDIVDLKQKHQTAQQMFQQNALSKDELVKIGLKLRKQENMLILIKNALNSTYDNQVTTSSYNDLIM